MSQIIRISHPQPLLIHHWSSQGTSLCPSGTIKPTSENIKSLLSWKSKELEEPALIVCQADLGRVQALNCISLALNKEYPDFFPSRFRFDISTDGKIWEPLFQEQAYKPSDKGPFRWDFVLSYTRYLKLVIQTQKKLPNGKYFAALGELQASIKGVSQITVSTELDRLWVKENLTDGRKEYGWSSAPSSEQKEESVQIDLAMSHTLCEIRLLSKQDEIHYFPENFHFLYSEDGLSWHFLHEEKGFLAESGTCYRWRFLPFSARHLRLICRELPRTPEGKYIVQLIEIEIYAFLPEMPGGALTSHSWKDVSLPRLASTLSSGLVRLASDGETKEGVVIQGNDRRLQNATVKHAGIVELALDGETKEGVAIQGNDRRLRYATETSSGIVRFAQNSEKKKGFAVQADDSRLENASEDRAGLIELASDGENRSGVVVQGNDSRLRNSTENFHGIVRLAKDESTNPNEAVQGNDRRLHRGNVEYPGIVRFAKHGEKASKAAIQSDDPRLNDASVQKKGVVILARDGGIEPQTVIQANDSRLQEASTESKGIVEVARLGSNSPGTVVQANDPRLSDKRHPMPHEHDYAHKSHRFEDHQGSLKIQKAQGTVIAKLGSPPDDHASIVGVNDGGGAGILGRGQEGVTGAGLETGVVGLGLGGGRGVLGASRRSAGGAFVSENFYSLTAGHSPQGRSFSSSSLAFLAQGASHFRGALFVDGQPSCIALYFPTSKKDFLQANDIAAIKEEGDFLYKPTIKNDSQVFGVVVSSASFVCNPPKGFLPDLNEEEAAPFVFQPIPDHILVAVAGIVEVRVIAGRVPVMAGNLLVSSDEPGYAQRAESGGYKAGAVFGRSLGKMEAGKKGKLRVLLTAA